MELESLAGFSADTFNPHDQHFLKHPYLYYRWFREHQPVSRVIDPMDDDAESYWVFCHEDITRILKASADWIKEDPNESLIEGMFTKSMFASDGGHCQQRAVLDSLLPQAMATVHNVATEQAAMLVHELRDREVFDVSTEFARPLTSEVLRSFLGVPTEHWPQLTQLVDEILVASNPGNDSKAVAVGKAAMIELRGRYLAMIEGSPKSFEAGRMIDLMIQRSNNEPEFTTRVVCANATSLTVAGAFSTTFLLGSAITRLLEHPDLLDRVIDSLHSNDDYLQRVVTEALRFDSPVQMVKRYATANLTLNGVRISRDSEIKLVLGSGNRDESVFTDAEAFNPERSFEGLLSFGHGIHHCLGNPIFDIVAPIGLKAVLNGFPGALCQEPPQWQYDPALRGVSNLYLEKGQSAP